MAWPIRASCVSIDLSCGTKSSWTDAQSIPSQQHLEVVHVRIVGIVYVVVATSLQTIADHLNEETTESPFTVTLPPNKNHCNVFVAH